MYPPRIQQVKSFDGTSINKCVVGESILTGPQSTHASVEVLKSWLDETHDIPYRSSSLFLNGRIMIDPLSLGDFDEIAKAGGATVEVKISGDGDEEVSVK